MTYSPIVMDHFGNPRNIGKPPVYNASGTAGNPHGGLFLVVYLNVVEGMIQNAAFQTYGCAAAIAAGSLLTEMIKGKSVQEASRFEAPVLREKLGGLPLGKEQCADLAVSALKNALAQMEKSFSQEGSGG